MPYLLTLLIGVLFSFNTFAQTTSTPEAPSVPALSVSLDIKVVDVLLNDEHRSGVDWEAIVWDFHTLQLKKENNPIWTDKKYKLSAGVISKEDYAVLIDALDTVGHFVAKDFPQTALNKGESKVIDIQTDPKGLPMQLEMMWLNSPAGENKIQLGPGYTVLIKDSDNVTEPVMLKTQTQMDLKDNTTVVLGSFMHEEEISQVRKFPLLGDLPLVGLVFRKQGKLMQVTETIIFITIHTHSVQMPLAEETGAS